MLLPFLYHSCSYILFFTSYACRHTKTGLWTACPKNLLEHLGITVRCLDEQLGLMFRIYPLFQHFNTFGPFSRVYRKVTVESKTLPVEAGRHHGQNHGRRPHQRNDPQSLTLGNGYHIGSPGSATAGQPASEITPTGIPCSKGCR